MFTAITSTIHSALVAPGEVPDGGIAGIRRQRDHRSRILAAVLRRTGNRRQAVCDLRRPRDAICLSLYRDRRYGSFGVEEFNKIDAIKAPLAAALERHLDLNPTPTRRACRMTDILQSIEGVPMLSSREAAICARIVTGYSNEAIALDLGISFHSVRTYRRRAYEKLNVTSQNELLLKF